MQSTAQRVDLALPNTFEAGANDLKAADPQAAMPDQILNDRKFVNRCERLTRIRMLLLLKGIVPPNLRDWPDLEAAKYRRTGRPALASEWRALQSAEEHIATLETPELRLHLRTATARRTVRSWSIVSLIVGMAAFAVVLLVFALFEGGCISAGSCDAAKTSLPAIGRVLNTLCYMLFALALGAMGSAASIALNSLSAKSDDKFDLTDKDLVIMRIVAGSLFGLTLSIPWSAPIFAQLTRELALSNTFTLLEDPKKTIFMILPFMIGFSTALVLLVINRVVSGFEAVFGFQRRIDAENSGGESR